MPARSKSVLAASFAAYKLQVKFAFNWAKRGKTDQLFQLIALGLSTNTTNSKGLSLLHFAAGHGQTDTVVQLLRHGAEKAIVARAFGTPLHQAAGKCHLETVRVMLKEGCPVDVMSDTGGSVLHFAAGGGDVEVIRAVWGAGCDLNAKDNDGETPLHWAARSSSTKATVELIRSGAKKAEVAGVIGTPLHIAALMGHQLTVMAMLAEGCPVDTVSRYHASVLHFAAFSGNVEVLRVVLGAGGNINATDNYGMTPLHWAARSGKAKAVLGLMKLGAKTSIVAGKCGVPLHQAAMCGDESTVRAMLEAGHPVEVVDVDGSTVLHFAAFEGHVCIIHLLAKFGFDVRHRDNYGLTPFHYAVLFGHVESVKALLQLGADPRVQSPMFGTAMNLAQICGRKELEGVLSAFVEEDTQPVYDSIVQLSTQPESCATDKSLPILADTECGISKFELALFVAIDGNRLRTLSNMASILSTLSKQQHIDLHKIACLAAIHGDVAILEHLMADTISAGTYTKPMHVSSLLEQFFPHLKTSQSQDILRIQRLIPPECAVNPLVLAITSLSICSKQRKYHIFMQQSSRNHIEVIQTLVTSTTFCNTLNEHLANGLTPLDLAEQFELREAASIIANAGGKHGIWAEIPQQVQPLGIVACQAMALLKSFGEAGEQAFQVILKFTGCTCVHSTEPLPMTTPGHKLAANRQKQVLEQRPDMSLIIRTILPKVNLDVWEEVGYLLHVPESTLKELDQNQPKVRDKYRKTLAYWLDHTEAGSWEELLKVLGHFETKHMVEELTQNIFELQMKVRLQTG